MDDLVDKSKVLVAINRRSFIKFTSATILMSAVGALGMGACSSWRNECQVPLAPKESYRLDGEQIVLSLPTVNPLSAIGGAVRLVFRENEETVWRLIVIRSEDRKYHAIADHCTHNDKELYYLNEGKVLRCHSGRSYFNMEGNVIKGPAEKPLRVFPTWQEDDQLMIEMKNKGTLCPIMLPS